MAKRMRHVHKPFEGPVALQPGSLGDFGPVLGLGLNGPVKTFVFVNKHFDANIFTKSASLFGCKLIQHEKIKGLTFDTQFNPESGITLLHILNCFLGRDELDIDAHQKYYDLIRESTYLVVIGIMFQEDLIEYMANQEYEILTIVTDSRFTLDRLKIPKRQMGDKILGKIFRRSIQLGGRAQTFQNNLTLSKVCYPTSSSVYLCNDEEDVTVTETKL